jgi:hypothetical protein
MWRGQLTPSPKSQARLGLSAEPGRSSVSGEADCRPPGWRRHRGQVHDLQAGGPAHDRLPGQCRPGGGQQSQGPRDGVRGGRPPQARAKSPAAWHRPTGQFIIGLPALTEPRPMPPAPADSSGSLAPWHRQARRSRSAWIIRAAACDRDRPRAGSAVNEKRPFTRYGTTWQKASGTS